MIPIPFFGWLMDDEDDKEQMLRDQIHVQQNHIKKLEAEVTQLQAECSSLIKQIGEVK
jgi:peptidoglycan hydrolase CwlO-like protein